jgi:basic membrane protein A
MTRIFRLVAAAAVVMILVVTPVAARGLNVHHQAATKHLVVGLVLDVGGINDKSFNHLAYTGLINARDAFGAKVSYIATSEQAQYVPNLTHYAQLHPNLIIATGGLMSQAILTVAQQFPNQKFAIIDGQPSDTNFVVHEQPNVADLLFPEQQPGFLAGVIAGLMEKNKVGAAKHNTIGYMSGIPVPAVIRYEAGYVQGARKVDPGIKVLAGNNNSFTNVATANGIGRTQISQGADILFGVAGGAGLGYLRAAQTAGKYGIGVDADQGYLGKYIITSAEKHVETAVYNTIRDLAHGYFKSGPHHFNAKNAGIGFGPPSSVVPKSYVAIANHYLSLMKSGKLKVSPAIPSS